MADVRQFRQDTQITHGTIASTNAKLTDILPLQHEDLASNVNQMNKISLGQCLCEPYAVCNSNNPANGAYVADCVNFPDFALSFTDGQGNSHALVGLKIRVLFTYGITYGSVSGGTYPTLNINGSGAIPLLAQGKTMGAGAISADQTVEFTIIPYGNGLAFDADSNVRESNSDYTVHTDGSITYTDKGVENYGKGKKYTGTLADNSYFNIGNDCGFLEYSYIEFDLTVWDSDTFNNIVIHGFYLRDSFMKDDIVAKVGMDRTGENIYGTLVISGLNQTANKNKFECYIKYV